MSLSETLMGVNSRALDTPLNHLIWLNDYKTYGEDSYVFQNKDIWNELMMSRCSIDDRSMVGHVHQYANEHNRIGEVMKLTYGIDKSINWSTIHNINDVCSNPDAIVSVLLNDVTRQTYIKYFAESENAMNYICSNRLCLSALYDDYTHILEDFSNSPYLLSACQASPLYEVTTNDTQIYYVNSNARRIHYANKCFVLGMSQKAGSPNSYNSYVDTLNGVMTTTSAASYGESGLSWLIKQFAPSAACHPFSYSDAASSSWTTSPSYMAILKIE